jgi:hypothetical protein
MMKVSGIAALMLAQVFAIMGLYYFRVTQRLSLATSEAVVFGMPSMAAFIIGLFMFRASRAERWASASSILIEWRRSAVSLSRGTVCSAVFRS